MNQTEIIIKALKKLGGRGTVRDICLLGKFYIGSNSKAQSVDANIRRILNSNPSIFRHPEGVDKGIWELVSYKNDMDNLRQQLTEKEEECRQLSAVPKAKALVEELLKETMNVTKHDRKKADIVRMLLRNLGYFEEALALDAFIEEKEEALTKALEKLNIHNVSMTGQNAHYYENNINQNQNAKTY